MIPFCLYSQSSSQYDEASKSVAKSAPLSSLSGDWIMIDQKQPEKLTTEVKLKNNGMGVFVEESIIDLGGFQGHFFIGVPILLTKKGNVVTYKLIRSKTQVRDYFVSGEDTPQKRSIAEKTKKQIQETAKKLNDSSGTWILYKLGKQDIVFEQNSKIFILKTPQLARKDAEEFAKRKAEKLAKEEAIAQARALEEAAKRARKEELRRTLFDKNNDVKIVYESTGGNTTVFLNLNFSSHITKMYVDYEEVPVSDVIKTKPGVVEVIYKTDGIEEIPEDTFWGFDGKGGSAAILEMHFPACLKKLNSGNGTGCIYCSDIYFYGTKAPKGPGLLSEYIFSDLGNNGVGSQSSKKYLHIMSGAKGFSGIRANPSYLHLTNSLGFRIVEM